MGAPNVGVTVNCNTNCNKFCPRICGTGAREEPSSDMYSKKEMEKAVARAVMDALSSSDDYSEQEEEPSQLTKRPLTRRCTLLQKNQELTYLRFNN